MEIILNTNELGYNPFLYTDVDSFVVGLKKFSVNQKYCLGIKELSDATYRIKERNKNLYLSINLFAKEKDIKRFRKIISKIGKLDITAFIVSDLGILNIFKEHNLEDKVILDLHTYVTNKYSAKALLDLGVKRVCLSKEITLEDIQDISTFNEGKIEVLCQGYNPITYSKRSILDYYYKNFKLKKTNDLHFIKEESRDNYYYLDENKECLTVYNDKQYSLFSYLPELINSNIKHFRIDTNFLNKDEIAEYIEFYKKGIEYITSDNLEKYNVLKEEFAKKYTYDTPFLHNESFLLKEGK